MILLAFIAGALASQALEAVIVRALVRVSRRPAFKQYAEEKNIDLKAKGKILKVNEWMFRKKVEEGANPFDIPINDNDE